MSEAVEVTGADREAAAALAEWHTNAARQWETVNGGTMQWFTNDFPKGVRAGIWDNHDFVQAFARHRHEATRALSAQVEELREGLAPFASLAEVILGQAPASSDHVVLFRSHDGVSHSITLDKLRRATLLAKHKETGV